MKHAVSLQKTGAYAAVLASLAKLSLSQQNADESDVERLISLLNNLTYIIIILTILVFNLMMLRLSGSMRIMIQSRCSMPKKKELKTTSPDYSRPQSLLRNKSPTSTESSDNRYIITIKLIRLPLLKLPLTRRAETRNFWMMLLPYVDHLRLNTLLPLLVEDKNQSSLPSQRGW